MRRAALVTTVVLALLAVAARLDPLPQGLTATYFGDANWSSTPARTLLEPQPSTDGLRAAWHGQPPPTFSVTWAGSLLVPRSGTYTIESDSDDGAWIVVDGRPIVDDGGRHMERSARGTVRLERGVHEIFIRYFQDGGDYAFALRWAYEREALAPIPAWALWSRRTEFPRMLASALLRRALTAVLWFWCALLLVAVMVGVSRSIRRAAAYVWADPIRRALACVVAASALLNVAGIWWGLPSAWAGDELTPKAVLIALSHRFTAGWFDRYPPLHFYALTLAYSPLLVADALGWVHLADPQQVTALSILGRLVSVAAAAGTSIATYVCGARTFGRRAGLFGAIALALVPMFIFYAKTANPELSYVFWFVVALAFYLRALDTGALRDVALFAASAAMSICTKDQAYALFISMPILLMLRWHIVGARRLVVGGLVAAAVFIAVQNIPLNAAGFVSHLRDITGPGRNYRMFPPTSSGQLGLLAMTLGLEVRSWGWPLFAAGVGGVAIAFRDRSLRAPAVTLALVAGTYYVGFIAVVLYDYDRYLLPICVVHALFAGLALDRLVAANRAWTRALAPLVLAYSLLYGATVDVLMIRDTRYDAERWLVAHAGSDHLVATTFQDVVNPRTVALRSVDLHTTPDLLRWQPDYFVVNADYARALASHRPEASLLTGLRDGSLGYRLAYRHRTAPPWPWLPAADPDLVGPRTDGRVLSFLRDVSPTIEIYEREGS